MLYDGGKVEIEEDATDMLMKSGILQTTTGRDQGIRAHFEGGKTMKKTKKQQQGTTVPYTFRIDCRILAALEEIKNRVGVPVSVQIRKTLAEHVERNK